MSDVTKISAATGTAPQEALARIPVQTLGQDEFLKILVTQLTTQDPMNPQKDTEFVAQMAQFSQLESSKSLMAELTSMRQQQDFVSANSLIGRTVQFAGEDDAVVGTVTGVQMSEGKSLVMVGDQTFELADVLRVGEGSTATVPPRIE